MPAERITHTDFLFRARQALATPAYWYPGPEVRKGVSGEDVETGEHEGNHAEGLGGRHGEIVVQKTATTKGTTEILDGTDPYTASVGAAAGAVETSEHPAEGFGHDMTIIDRLGVMSRQEAIRRARAIISANKPEVRRKWGEIIAFQGRIGAGEFRRVKQQAEQEVQLEESLPEKRKELWHTFETLPDEEKKSVTNRSGIIVDFMKKEVALAA